MIINTEYIYKKYILEGGKLSYKAFKELLFEYNKQMIKECIKTGNVWHFKGELGILKVGKIKRKITVTDEGTIKCGINWKESNKLKDTIIARGEVPLENYRDEDGKIIKNNGGVPWLCYYTEDIYYRWAYSPHLYLKNSFKFKFTPSWTNKRMLSSSINEYSELIYKHLERRIA